MPRKTNDTIIKQWKRSEHRRIRITTNRYGGHDLFSIREWYRKSKGDEFRPGKMGISLTMSQLTKVLAGLKELRLQSKKVRAE